VKNQVHLSAYIDRFSGGGFREFQAWFESGDVRTAKPANRDGDNL
jgi:hypothetical protein